MEVNADEYMTTEQELRQFKRQGFLADMVEETSQERVEEDYLQLTDWENRPESFMRDVLDFVPWTCPNADDQRDIIYAIRDHDRVTVRSGNGPGKTAVAARIALWFLFCHYPSMVITTAPTGRQVEKLLWGEIRGAYKNAKVELGGEIFTTELRIEEKWYAIGFSTDEAEKFQGFHSPNILVIVDEAGGVEEIIFEAVEGILTTPNAKALLIGNPLNRVSYFGRTHLHPRESKEWYKLHLDNYNTPNVRARRNIYSYLCSYNWPEERKKKWGEHNPFFQVRVRGDFPEAGEDELVPYYLTHLALESTIPPIGKKVLGVDVARFGGDKSVIGRLWGGQFRILRKLYKMDGPKLADRIIRILKEDTDEQKIEEIKIDVIGWGSSCYDSLRSKQKTGTAEERRLLKGVKIIPINVSEKCRSKEARKDYFNVRAETAFVIKEMFEHESIDIEDEDLAVQLTNIKYKFREARYLLEKKEDFKKRFRESPDELDSLLIAKAIVRGGTPHIW